jgi:salicylate synthase
MTVLTGYHSRSVPVVGDPLALASGLAGGAAAPYVLYERDGEWLLGAGAAAEVVLDHERVRLRHGGLTVEEPVGGEPLQQVRDLLARVDVADWRAYGWAAFELGYLLHGPERGAGSGTLLHLVVPEREVVLDPVGARLRALRPGDLDELESALAELERAQHEPTATLHPVEVAECGAAEFRAAVAGAVADIRDRQLQKVILSRVVPVTHELDLAGTYRVGRAANTPARSFLLELGGLAAAGFSPETVVEVSGDGTVSTQPLAGTRARSGCQETDEQLRMELLGDPKEVFEHAISVQAAQHELGRVCVPDSLAITEFMTVRERGSVQHLASRVGGRLGAAHNAWHALGALFPAVTATGLPKPAACGTILHYESGPRGLYGGAVLVADAAGGLDAALVLRTVFRQDGRTWLRAGAGIVEQSRPQREFEETCEKLRSVSRYLVPRR